ncbi:uncharacterized protein [Antedon mediterranea]|uniref:uncharacterized protein n=1 Tax=Antedon mediterranea TaxID=105859 RepID=UPI003AF7C0A2
MFAPDNEFDTYPMLFLGEQAIGLYLNIKKTQFIHLNPSSPSITLALDGSAIEQVEDFKYLGSYCSSTNHDVEARLSQAWGALNSLSKIWASRINKSTKIRLFRSTVEAILLYGCETWSLTSSLSKSLDGAYTRMLRKVQNIPWSSHATNKTLYANLPRLTTIIQRRRMGLAGHVMRSSEPASRVLLWEPEEKRKVGRPQLTSLDILLKDTKLDLSELRKSMLDRDVWRQIIMAPT